MLALDPPPAQGVGRGRGASVSLSASASSVNRSEETPLILKIQWNSSSGNSRGTRITKTEVSENVVTLLGKRVLVDCVPDIAFSQKLRG